MINFSKTSLLLILLIIFVIIAGFFAFQWWQEKGELGKKIEENENLIKQTNELQKEIEELKSAQAIEDKTIEDKKSEVTIVVDKAEYKQGEEVKISVDYDGNLYVWDPPSCWSIQKSINDSLVELHKFSSNPCIRECKDVPLDRIIDCASCPLELPTWQLKKTNSITFIWDQRYKISEKTYQCHGWNGKVINEKCVNYSQTPPGEYKIRLEYALKIKNEVGREDVDIKYTEEEFKIVK